MVCIGSIGSQWLQSDEFGQKNYDKKKPTQNKSVNVEQVWQNAFVFVLKISKAY